MGTNIHGFKQDILLTNYTRLLGPSLDSFIADSVFPAVEVPTKSGKFLNVDEAFVGASPGHGMIIADGQLHPLNIPVKISQVTGWDVDLNGLGTRLSKHIEGYSAGNGLDLRKAHAALLTRHTAVIRERLAAAIAFSTTVFTGKTAALSGTDQWSNAASDPLSQAEDARDNVSQQSGEEPDTLIVGYDVDKQLRQHPLIRERAKHSNNQVGPIRDSIIAEALGVSRYVVGKAIADTTVEGQTVSKARIWGKFALFCKLRSSPAPMTPQSCLQRWKFAGSTDGAVSIERLSELVEQMNQMWNDQYAAPTTELGYLYSTVVA